MHRSAVRRRVHVPTATTSKSQTKDYQYSRGLNSNSSNDDVQPDQWVYATDTRQYRIGKWDTRRGNDLLSIPIGETVNVQQAATTGASAFNFNTTVWFAQPLVATATGRLTLLEAGLSNPSAATGTIVLAVYSNNSGNPGTELVRTTIAASSPNTSSFDYQKARTITCPDITAGSTYHVVGYVQTGGTGSYKVSTTTNATTGKVSNDGGVTWTAASYSFNVKLYTATPTGSKGTIRIRRPNGTSYTFIAHGTTLYSVNETSGVTTAVDTGLNSASSRVRFEYVNDVLRYTQVGVAEKPRKYDFTTASSVSTALENTSAIINHKVYQFYISADDPTRIFYTDAGQFDAFTSTNFQHVPAPKTGDPCVGFSKLNGYLYIHTRNNKYVYAGDQPATFQLENAIGQKGTFSQESVAYDEDYIYLASDDGIYRFNGAEETNIATDVLDWWEGLLNKRNTVLELHNNRLYVFYTPNGQSANTRCKVYHVLYGIWESDDSRAYVGSVYASADQTGYFIQASNRVGMLMLAEQDTNDHNTMSEPLSYELRTKYDHYGSPAQPKRCPAYRPHFDSVSGSYGITVGYATDYSDSPTDNVIPLSGSGPRFNTGLTFDSGLTFGGSAQINPTDDAPVIPGNFRRLQIRYSHDAAREPVSFDGHVVSIETERLL